jgi:hypothetical protein
MLSLPGEFAKVGKLSFSDNPFFESGLRQEKN